MLPDNPILAPLIIMILRVLDVSMGTMRIIMVFRGRKIIAAAIGFVEVTIFVLVLGSVVQNLNNIPNVLAYSLGFAGGTLLGSFIEEKMALGFMTVQIIPSVDAVIASGRLRDAGFGLTSFEAWGRSGPKIVLMIHLFRKDWKRLKSIVEEIDPQAFITVMDTRSTKGGYLRLLKKTK